MGKPVEKRPSLTKKYRCPLVTGGLILATGLIVSNYPPTLTPVISIQDGQIQGVVDYSRNGTEFYSFKGIPYAVPPVGKLRFASPIQIQPWKGVIQTTQFKPHCKQFDAMIYHEVFGELDCLHLNVFAHPMKAGERRPVLVYMAGGGFMSGGGNYYHPNYFMDHNLVLVVFNYRLGPFGFLNLETEQGDGSLPRGNMGLKDQVLALKWVQRNIEYFGGDPGRVTIFGQSAGAVSVHAHILSPQSRGLFHRAIAHSGSLYCPWGYSKKWREVSTNLVQKLKCPMDDRNKMMECLQNYDPDEMVKHQVSMVELKLEKDLLLPSVESFKADDMFLGDLPAELAKTGEFAKVPLLLGVNQKEGAFRVARFDALPDPDVISQYETDWAKLLPMFFGFDSLPTNLSNDVRHHYFGSNSPNFTADPSSFKHMMATIASHVSMFEPGNRMAMTHARSGSPTFMYFYNYRSKCMPEMYSVYRAVRTNDWLPPKLKAKFVTFIDFINEYILGNEGSHEYGVVHGSDLYQLWNIDGETGIFTFWDLDFSQSFVQMIVDFVHDTQPFTYRGTEWQPINVSAVDNGEKIQYMLLDNSTGKGEMIPEPFTEEIQYWKNIGIDNV